jgi:hypothetical protein
MYGMQYLVVTINDYVTGLYIYCTILFIVILECTPPGYFKKLTVKQYAVLPRQLSHASQIYWVSWLQKECD